jgi:hypothetical protein
MLMYGAVVCFSNLIMLVTKHADDCSVWLRMLILYLCQPSNRRSNNFSFSNNILSLNVTTVHLFQIWIASDPNISTVRTFEIETTLVAWRDVFKPPALK